MAPSRQRHWNTRNQVRALTRLVVSVGKKIRICESIERASTNATAEVHLYREWMSGVPKPNRAQAPASHNFSERSRIVQVCLPGPKGQFVNCIQCEIVAYVEDARPFVALQAIDVFRPVRLTTSDGPVVD